MTRSIRTLLAGLAASALASAVLALPAAVAYAGEDDNHHPAPRPGVACPADQVGKTAQLETRNGLQTYRCEQRPDDQCPVWHWVYNPDVPKGQTAATGCPECPSAPPSSAPPPAVPPASPPVQPPPARATLPVTDDLTLPPWVLAAAVLAVVAGAGLYWVGRRPIDTR